MLNIFGPPGTGKTRNLTAIFGVGVQRYGAQRVAAVTYTKAAGNELKERLGPMLGVRDDPRSLQAAMPYVGTIHSLCFRALGNPMIVDAKRLQGFVHDYKLVSERETSQKYLASDPDGAELGYDVASIAENPSIANDEAEVLRVLYGAARHRQETLATTYLRLPDDWQGLSFERLQWLVTKYEDWKMREHLMDFEDLLEEGARRPPPVDVLICDEVQDNSRLMWHVIDAWSHAVQQFIAAGDPYQAIYLFSGADPQLFLQRPGERVLLRESHRLSQGAVEFANGVLTNGGHEGGDVIGQWVGQKEGTAQDGSEFFLARTHRLLAPIRGDLYARGIPFLEMRGTSPWDSHDGQAYRLLTQLIRGDMIGRPGLTVIAKSGARKHIPSGKLQRVLKDRDEDPVGPGEAERLLGDLSEALTSTRHFEYLRKVEERGGLAALYTRPKTQLGTIHAAKGKEADTVHVVRSWGFRPAQSLDDPESRRGEACVAYVAATRHRVALHMLDGGEGYEYPWP